MQIKLDNRTRRELSDVVHMAKLVKKFNSKLIDMYSYTSRNSLALKIENWEIFNFKVLRKLGLRLSSDDLTQLASGSLTSLKCLLYHLMKSDRRELLQKRTLKTQSYSVEGQKLSDSLSLSEKSVIEQQSKEDLQHELTPKDSKADVPYAKYKQLVRENYKKKKYLSSIAHKTKYLQSLILVKEERINYLLEQLAALST
ncbi:uncharacterized protein LOC111601435 [Drosophila hydei]|uniref:Uncharacterized protein LOC111601435 n=1 Tax=Drosophila hydei TaxID=7224 RepID=A0A6J1LZB4_DROHY|nr:uncharacterized protein LOC111601435 [Drosophila hydei]